MQGSNVTSVLFDLDGTLVPMDAEVFIKRLMTLLEKFMTDSGVDGPRFCAASYKGVNDMYAPHSELNHDVFWKRMRGEYPTSIDLERAYLDFYDGSGYRSIGDDVVPLPAAKAVIDEFARTSKRLVLATNPVYPRNAIEGRLRWAGIDPAMFNIIATYNTSHFIKPSIGYYREILGWLDCDASECLMVGNNVLEDMKAAEIGMQTFLATPYLMNPEGADTSRYRQGTLDDLLEIARAAR